MDAGGERVVLGAFVMNALLAGANSVGIRFSNRELDPVWGAGLRFALAAILMWGAYGGAAARAPARPWAGGRGAVGVLNFAAGFALAYLALVELHAGFGQILLALVPLATLLHAVAWRRSISERRRWRARCWRSRVSA